MFSFYNIFSFQMAKRAVVQSAARELGPQGVHVAHVIVDGVVDNPNTRAYFAQKVGHLAPFTLVHICVVYK